MNVLILSTDKKPPAFDYINMFLLLCLSGITFFDGHIGFLVLVFCLNLGLFIYRKENIDNGFITFLVFFILLTAAQILWLSDGSLVSFTGMVLRTCTAYLVLKNCSDFISTFLKVLFFLSLAGIFLYVFFIIFPSIEQMLFEKKHVWDNAEKYHADKSLIIYTIHRENFYGLDPMGLFGLPRNSGPFWEPGAYGGYLVLGIVTEMLLFRKLSRRAWVFLVALFTTYSTTAYLAVGVFFVLYYLLVDNKAERLIVIVPLLVILIWISLFSLEFLSAKIVHQLKEFNEGNVYSSQPENDTRIGSASLDFKDLQRSPIFGTGSSDETRWGPNEKLFMRTNGITDFLVRMGIVGFTFCIFFMFNACKKLFQRLETPKPSASGFVLVFMIFFVSLGETFFVTVFFWSFFFIQYNNLVFEPETVETI
jgi:hypothetical protein